MAKNLCYFSIVLVIQHLIVGVTDGLPTGNPNAQTCVIGAGYSGLAAARYLKQYGVNFKVLEATRYVGGTWRFDPHVGFDQDGVPLFTRQYKNLRTNTPRQTMEYVGFSFPEDTPSYPAGTCFYEYLKAFAKHFELAKHIQFQSLITSVKWSNDSWKVTYTRTDTRNNETESCDYLIIATGQYRKPKMPKIMGQELFKGKVIHSCDYKEAEPFRNRRVLLVGAGASGLDLSTQLVNITSKLVHSHHLTYNQPNHPKTYIKKPDIKAFTSNGVMFQDDSFEEVEDVIFCTGYDLDYPFLDASSGVTITPKFVLPLYQNIVNIRRPSMMFMAVPKGVINRVYDVQGEYIAALISGKFQLPTQEEMLKHWIKRVYYLRSLGKKIVDVNLIGNEMDQYFANLTQEANVTRAPPVLTDIRDFNAVYRLKDLLNYRDYDYKIIDDKHYERLYNPRKDLTCPVDNSK